MVFFFEFEQAIAVFQGHVGVVDRARTDDYEQTVQRVGALDDVSGLFSALKNGLSGFFGESNLMLKEIGRCEGVVTTDCSISFLFPFLSYCGGNSEEVRTSVVFQAIGISQVGIIYEEL